MTPTTAQQNAIEHRGSDLLVAASAGAGKTETLARRCAALIAGDGRPGTEAAKGCDVSELLVVTFTRAAAAELRARVGRMLRQRAAEERDARRRDHLQLQVLRLPTAEIGTLDAWCGRLLREFYAEAEIDAGYTVLGAEEEALLRANCLDGLFESIFAEPDAAAPVIAPATTPAAAAAGAAATASAVGEAGRLPDELVGAARDWLRTHPRADDAFLRELIRLLNGQRGKVLNPEAWLARVAAEATGDDPTLRQRAAAHLAEMIRDECAFQAGELESLLSVSAPDSLGADAAGLSAYAQSLRTWSQRLATAPASGELLGALTAEITAIKKTLSKSTAIGRLIADRWYTGRLLKRAEAVARDELIAVAPLAARRLRTLLELEHAYHHRLLAAKRARQAWGFEDIQRRALDLLGTTAADAAPDAPRAPTPLAERLRRRYAHVLVDEYQDTSPVQVELLRLVSRDNAFYVGDVKQSIYGFRRAEPRLFAELAGDFAAGRRPGRTQHLADNFRSHAGVLEPLNELFERLFSRTFGGTEYGPAERLTARRTETPNPVLDAAPRLELWLVPPAGSEDAAEAGEEAAAEQELEQVEREARAVAAEIRAWQARGPCIPSRGADGVTTLRALRLTDVVILVRSARQNAVLIARTLRAAGLACQTSGRDALLDSVEVLDLVQVLRLLSNRRQDMPLAAYLRSPLAGLSAADLLALRREFPGGTFADAVLACAERGATTPQRARLRAALQQLDEWATAARDVELPALLRQIIRAGGYRHFARGLPLGAQRVAALDSLVHAAEEFAAHATGGPAAFIEYLDALTAEEVAVAAPQPSEGDAVQVLTIHAAKGLEYPVVFLLNCGARFNQRSQAAPLQADEHGRCGWRGFDFPLRREVASPAHLPLRLDVQRRELEEELRLLYVAATRAREKLYIVGRMAAERWDDILRETPLGDHVPLITRLTASCVLEWTLQAAAAARLPLSTPDSPDAPQPGDAAAVLRIIAAPADAAPPNAAPGPQGPAALKPDDVEWVRRARTWILSPPPAPAAHLPAVVSVSVLKGHLTEEDEQTARPAWAGLGELAGLGGLAGLDGLDGLAPPAFIRQEAGGQALGSAVHRFLQFANLQTLASTAALSAERDRLIAAGRLTPVEAALLPLDDLNWLGGTALGHRLAAAADRLLRELPFVLAIPVAGLDESVIVRGVIDALLPAGTGCELIDYKSDQPSSAADFDARVAGYTRQVGMYAAAATRLLGRPVTAATLVFLRRRELLPVALPASDDWLSAGLSLRTHG